MKRRQQNNDKMCNQYLANIYNRAEIGPTYHAHCAREHLDLPSHQRPVGVACPDQYVRLREETFGHGGDKRKNGKELRLGFTKTKLLSLAAHIVRWVTRDRDRHQRPASAWNDSANPGFGRTYEVDVDETHFTTPAEPGQEEQQNIKNIKTVSTYNPVRLTIPQPKVYGAHIMEDLDTWIAGMRDYFDLADVPSECKAKILGCFLEAPPAVTYRNADEHT